MILFSSWVYLLVKHLISNTSQQVAARQLNQQMIPKEQQEHEDQPLLKLFGLNSTSQWVLFHPLIVFKDRLCFKQQGGLSFKITNCLPSALSWPNFSRASLFLQVPELCLSPSKHTKSGMCPPSQLLLRTDWQQPDTLLSEPTSHFPLLLQLPSPPKIQLIFGCFLLIL